VGSKYSHNDFARARSGYGKALFHYDHCGDEQDQKKLLAAHFHPKLLLNNGPGALNIY
jgi:hypothetical protein